MSRKLERFLKTTSLEKASHHAILTRAEEAALGYRIRAGGQDGEKAKETLFRHNLRLAMDAASRYTKHTSILTYEDLILEACVGLMRAVEKYDPDRGTKFSTYAVWWCLQSCKKAVANAPSGLRLSINLESELRYICIRTDEGNPNRVTDEEIAKDLGISVEDVWKKKLYYERSKSPIAEPNEDMWSISDRTEADVDDLGTHTYLSNRITGILSALSEQEVAVLQARYGLGDSDPMEFTEVGEMLGIEPHKARQIEEKAMSVLRHPSSEIINIPELGVEGIFRKDDI